VWKEKRKIIKPPQIKILGERLLYIIRNATLQHWLKYWRKIDIILVKNNVKKNGISFSEENGTAHRNSTPYLLVHH